MKCEDCEFYNEFENRQFASVLRLGGCCRRFPTPPWRFDSGRWYFNITPVQVNDYCGEFKQGPPRPKKKDEPPEQEASIVPNIATPKEAPKRAKEREAKKRKPGK